MVQEANQNTPDNPTTSATKDEKREKVEKDRNRVADEARWVGAFSGPEATWSIHQAHKSEDHLLGGKGKGKAEAPHNTEGP